jgi:hypothetical protein
VVGEGVGGEGEGTMKQCWKAAGLTARGAKIADRAMLQAQKLLAECGGDLALASVVLAEIDFRMNELPVRSATFRRDYLKKNGGTP